MIPIWRFPLERNRSQRGRCLEPIGAAEVDQARDSPVDPDHDRIGWSWLRAATGIVFTRF